MYYGGWNDGGGGGSWMWIPMIIMMIAFWGGLAWIAVTVIRRPQHSQYPEIPGTAPAPAIKQTPQEILAERLARSEIEPDEYHKRLEALDRPGSP